MTQASSRRKFLSLLGLTPIAPIAAGLAATFPRDSINSTRTVLREHVTYYVRTDGTATTGVGSANDPAHAFPHPQDAYNWISDNIDGGGKYVKIKMAAGTYTPVETQRENFDAGSFTAVMYMDRHIPGVSSLIIEGEPGVIFCGFGVIINTGGFFRFRRIKFEGTQPDDRGIFCLGAGATVSISDGCEFGAFAGINSAHMHLYGPCILKNFADYTISGGAHRHVFLEGQSALDNESSKITLTNAPAFAVYLHVAAQSHAAIINMTFIGFATGTRFIREGAYIGVYPAQDLNTLLPGDQNGLERDPDHYARGAV
jgi:hypothetical protein